MSRLTDSPAWQALVAHAPEVPPATALLDADPGRAAAWSAEGAGLYLNYARQRADDETLRRLSALARQQDLVGGIAAMLGGEPVNVTERRAALHAGLRVPSDGVASVVGASVLREVHGVLDHACRFADRVLLGDWRGYDGTPVTDVVNIGIGGSDLGPRMVCEALAHVADGPRIHFVSNVDGADLSAVLGRVAPASTLWVITSKTFTTQETMANAQAARAWFLEHAGRDDVARHFVAVSTNRDAVVAFGIGPENMFEFWDWVGGRYSLWSSVGLSIALSVGSDRFRQLLAGAHAMDVHFAQAPLERNLPVLMGLFGVWNTNFLGATSQVVAPYDQRLARFPAWLQQLEMESNGKRVDRRGNLVDYRTTPVLWGDVGTNAQHAFFQMLHQGPAVHPVDFIVVRDADHALPGQHRMLHANAVAQGESLMRGRDVDAVRDDLSAQGLDGADLEAALPHRVFPGGRPSNTLVLPRLEPRSLGSLLALYEHRAYVQSLLWDVNAFDQFGVELGKRVARDLLADASAGDAVSRVLMSRLSGKD